jgi:hypothetical protein
MGGEGMDLGDTQEAKWDKALARLEHMEEE